MKNTIVRLKRFALRRLWTETDHYKARRRCRTLIATPFAMLGGLTWGVFAAPTLAAGSQLFWGVMGAVTFGLFMYLEQRLVPPMRALAGQLDARAGPFAALAWEAGVVGGLIYLVTRVLAAPMVPAVGTALGIGAFYAVVMEYFVCGSAASNVAAMLWGGVRGGTPPRERLSRAEALVHRGDYEEALRLYRGAIARRPREASAYLQMARTLVVVDEPERAIELLRDAFMKARLTLIQEAFLVRQIHEICSSKLGDPAESRDDLRRLLERQPMGPHAEWATRELKELDERVGETDAV